MVYYAAQSHDTEIDGAPGDSGSQGIAEATAERVRLSGEILKVTAEATARGTRSSSGSDMYREKIE